MPQDSKFDAFWQRYGYLTNRPYLLKTPRYQLEATVQTSLTGCERHSRHAICRKRVLHPLKPGQQQPQGQTKDQSDKKAQTVFEPQFRPLELVVCFRRVQEKWAQPRVVLRRVSS